MQSCKQVCFQKQKACPAILLARREMVEHFLHTLIKLLMFLSDYPKECRWKIPPMIDFVASNRSTPRVPTL